MKCDQELANLLFNCSAEVIKPSVQLSTQLHACLSEQGTQVDSAEFTNDNHQERIWNLCKQLIIARNSNYLNSEKLSLPCPIVEKHPYLDDQELNPNFHKFIIGTFPPISYLLDLRPFAENLRLKISSGGRAVKRPDIPYFHGNRGHLWKILSDDLSQIIGNPAVDRIDKRNAVEDFLNNNQIIYTDVIRYCQRVEYNANDSGLRNIVLNSQLTEALLQVPRDKTPILVFITGTPIGVAGLLIRDDGLPIKTDQTFDLFLFLMKSAGYSLAISLNGNTWMELDGRYKQEIQEKFSLKVKIYLKIQERVFNVIIGPSPVPRASNHELISRWLHLNPRNTAKDLKKFIYRTALFGDNLDVLSSLNALPAL